MTTSRATIRSERTAERAADPTAIVVKHNRSGAARMEVPKVSGGAMLHLALSACVYGNVWRMAGERGVTLRSVAVSVDGEFLDDNTRSGPLSVDMVVDGDASEAQLRRLAADALADSAVAAILGRLTVVSMGSLDVRGSSAV